MPEKPPLASEDALVEHGYPLLLRAARRWAFPGLAAEDLAQEVALSSLRNLHTYRDKPASEQRAILYSAVWREARDQRRKRRPEALAQCEVEAAAADLVEIYPELVRALAQIKPEHALTVRLKWIDGLTHDEIAEVLGAPRTTIDTWAHRGLLELTLLLKEKP